MTIPVEADTQLHGDSMTKEEEDAYQAWWVKVREGNSEATMGQDND